MLTRPLVLAWDKQYPKRKPRSLASLLMGRVVGRWCFGYLHTYLQSRILLFVSCVHACSIVGGFPGRRGRVKVMQSSLSWTTNPSLSNVVVVVSSIETDY